MERTIQKPTSVLCACVRVYCCQEAQHVALGHAFHTLRAPCVARSNTGFWGFSILFCSKVKKTPRTSPPTTQPAASAPVSSAPLAQQVRAMTWAAGAAMRWAPAGLNSVCACHAAGPQKEQHAKAHTANSVLSHVCTKSRKGKAASALKACPSAPKLPLQQSTCSSRRQSEAAFTFTCKLAAWSKWVGSSCWLP
eukprot:1140421-Pelagomonas_calceolata.AAC.5